MQGILKRVFFIHLTLTLFPVLFLQAQVKVPIYTIQGAGKSSNYVGQVVQLEGIVTGDFQGESQLKGFFLQEASGDNKDETSDGIFVYSVIPANQGDHVIVVGVVNEMENSTEINNVSSVEIIDSGKFIAPLEIHLPTISVDDFERYEGMLVRFRDTLTVTDNFDLGRYGSLLLSSGGRLYTPTNYLDPNDDPASGNNSMGMGNVAAILSEQLRNANRSIILDDGSNEQYPAHIPFLDATAHTIRAGTKVFDLIGILGYGFGAYRIYPVGSPNFIYSKRPSVPKIGKSNLIIGSFNLYNYFNGTGDGGGFPTSRGASTALEFSRQRDKIFSAINSMNADLLGLMEMENDGDDNKSAISDLVTGLNESRNKDDKYAFISDPANLLGGTGTDAIKVGIIYKPSVLKPLGSSYSDPDMIYSRPPLAQTFSLLSNSEKFSLIVNHFKSKGCGSATGANKDLQDGQSCYNDKRKLESKALLNFIDTVKNTSKDEDVIIVGDFNAYEQEDPIDILLAGGLYNLISNSYSYNFNGEAGSLDHAFCTESVYERIVSAQKWHINSDEPQLLDYNLEHSQEDFYDASPYRSSDHDPIIIGLNMNDPSLNIHYVNANGNSTFKVYPNPFSKSIAFRYNLQNESHVELKIFNLQGIELKCLIHENQAAGEYNFIWECEDLNRLLISKENYFFKYTAIDNSGHTVIKTGKISCE